MPTFSRSVALVIGINEYSPGIPRLRTAVNDAVKVAEQLKDKHGYEVVLLKDGEATGAELRKLLGTGLTNLTEKDRLLVYFAGHGVALDGDDGPEGFLLLQDARASDPGSFFGMTELHRLLVALGCRHLLLVLDSCFAGAFRWSSTRHFALDHQVMYAERYERFTRDAAWQVLASAAYDQKALDVVDGRAIGIREEQALHSPFAGTLLDALEGKADMPSARGRGDGVITATELYLYLRDNIEVTEEGRARQTPSLWPLQKHDKGEYVFQTPGMTLDLPPAPKLDHENNPFRGLQPFEKEHQKFFFGRQRVTAQLQEHVGGHAFTLVLGASGSGKSSLVKAGLIPALGEKWEAMILRPGKHPLQALEKLELPVQAPMLGTLAQRAQAWLEMNPDRKLLLVVDQFEELITLADAAEALAFQEALTRLLPAVTQADSAHGATPTSLPDPGNQRLRMVATLRSDFAPQFATGPLRAWWMEGRFLIPSLSQNEIREAIEGPAAVQVIYYEPPSLVDTLINEVSQTPGALPLLSFTLSELYLKYVGREANNRAMTQADYEDLGGVAGSLRHRANAEYDGLKDDLHRETMRRIMLRMVSMGGGELARRRVPTEELVYADEKENARVATVLKHLSTARLIVFDTEPDETPVVEPAHDALVRGWDRLLEWKREATEEIQLRELLTPAAEDWRKNQGGLWEDNPRLDQLRPGKVKAMAWMKAKNEVGAKAVPKEDADSWMNLHERAFVDASVRRRRRKRGVLAGSAAAVIGVVIALAFVYMSLRASRILEATRKADNHATASLALAEQPSRILHALGQACFAAQSMPPGVSRQEVYLQRMLSLAKYAPDSIVNVGWPVRSAAFSPALDKVLVISNDDEFQVINPQTGEGFPTPRLESGESFRLYGGYRFSAPIFSDDGKSIAAIVSIRGEDGSEELLVVWDCATGEIRVETNLSGLLYYQRERNGVLYRVDSLAFTPDGKHVAVGISPGGHETHVSIWNCESGSEVAFASSPVVTKQFKDQNPLVLGNEWIAIAGRETGSVRLEPFGEKPGEAGGRDFKVEGEVKGLAVSRDSNYLAVITGSDSNSDAPRSECLGIWNTSTGKPAETHLRNAVIGISGIKNPITVRPKHGDHFILIDPGRQRFSILHFRDDSAEANFSVKMPGMPMNETRGLPPGTVIQSSAVSRKLLLTWQGRFESWNLDAGIPVMESPERYEFPSPYTSPLAEQAVGKLAIPSFEIPSNQVLTTAMRDDETLLAVVETSGRILCWKLPLATSGEVIGSLSPEELTLPIDHLQFSPDKESLVCSLADWRSRASGSELGYWAVTPNAKSTWKKPVNAAFRYWRPSLAVSSTGGLLALSPDVYRDEPYLLDLATGDSVPFPVIEVAEMTGFTRNGSLAFAGESTVSEGYESGIIPPDMLRKATASSGLPHRMPNPGIAIALCANPEYLITGASRDLAARVRQRAIARTSDGTRITPLLEFPDESLTMLAEAMFLQATDFQVAPDKLKIILAGGATVEMPFQPAQPASGDGSRQVNLTHVFPQVYAHAAVDSSRMLYPVDGTSVLVVGSDISWWELATGELMAQRISQESQVVGATLSEDGRHLLTGTKDGVIRRWPVSLPTRGPKTWLAQTGEALTGLDFSKTPPVPIEQETFKEIRAKVVKQVKAAAVKGDTCAEELLRHFER